MSEVEELRRRVAELEAKINTPVIDDWFEGVRVEAAHQRERWGVLHDSQKGPLDWYWTIGYLAQKVVVALIAGDVDKAKHHTISTGAAMFNWYRQVCGDKS